MTIYRSRMGEVAVRDCSIAELVLAGLAQRAEARPDAPALACGVTGASLTAAELGDRIRRLAGGLAARGFGPGKVAALMAPNMPDYATCFHGPLLAGGTVTTANPTYTADELRHQLTDAGAEILFTVPQAVGLATEAARGTAVTDIVAMGEADGAIPLDALMGEAMAGQVPVDLAGGVAVLPYSSGTTGLPKGVMLTHRNLVANIAQIEATMPIAPHEIGLAVLPYFHIYGMQVMMNLYLSRGAGVVTMPRFDLETYLRLIAEHRIERLYVAPPIVGALAKHPMVAEHDLSSLRMVLSGAAPLGGEVTEAAAARLGCEVFQGYGMTEMSPVSHFCRMGHGRKGSAGEIVPLMECRVIDPETRADVPAGEEGELWCRGPNVMAGYLNNPAATAATLVEDGWLRTGDIGRIDPDGYLYVSDRLKELIKVKGFQVAPAELEALLLTHPAVADAAVVGLPDDEAGERPVAWVVPQPGVALDPEEVADFVAGRVATYKRLARVEIAEAIPKSASGKILRRVLRTRALSPEP